MDARRLADVTAVADAGMISAANQRAIEEAGLSFILGMRIPEVPYVVDEWRRHHPDQPVSDGHIFTQPRPARPGRQTPRPDHLLPYKADRARRALRGIDEQVAKAANAVAGKAPVKRNRFIKLTGATVSVNRRLEAKARALAGLKGYITNLDATAEFVIDAYHRLFQIEKSFRMSKHDLQREVLRGHKRDRRRARAAISLIRLVASVSVVHEPPPPIPQAGRYWLRPGCTGDSPMNLRRRGCCTFVSWAHR
jgi:hypothetical protein